MNNLNIKVIVGSTRDGRFGDKVAEWIAGEIEKRQDLNVEILDLLDYQLPFFNEPVSPSMKTEPYKNPEVTKFTKKIEEADAFVVVTPEYNHSLPAVLKNAFDWVYQEWHNKPIAFVGYGSVGAARSIEHLRLIAIELQMAPIRNAVHIPGDQYFPVLFGQAPAGEMFGKMQKSADTTISQLIWWAKALKSARG